MKPPVKRKVPESPMWNSVYSSIAGNTKDPMQAPEREKPEAVARYFRKYRLTSIGKSVFPRATPIPKKLIHYQHIRNHLVGILN